MFIGHFGVGFAAKKINSKPSLGTLFLASQFIDLLWPIFLLLGLEQVKIEPSNTSFTPLNFITYPFTHSLLGVLFWALLVGSINYFVKKDLKTAMLLGALVCSHWVLDFITHKPDLQILPWSDLKVGLGLWNSIPITMIVEIAIFIVGVWYYHKSTKAKNKKGKWGFWILTIFLAVVYMMNIFGAPPPNEKIVAIVSLSLWLLVFWAYRIDINREVVK